MISRPLLRYLGGKWRLAPWVIGHFPEHGIYVEPFGGGGSVLLQKPPVKTEVYNDLDDELVNLFRVLRSAEGLELVRQLELTPYARREYLSSFEPTDDPVEQARRTIIRSHMAHGNMSLRRTRPSGFRVDGTTGNTSVGRNWADFPAAVAAIIERLSAVTIEQKPALDLINDYDDPRALLYLDPPYVRETRSQSHVLADSAALYRHEMDDEEHVALLDRVRAARSMVLISGYATKLYDDALKGWARRQVAARAHRNGARTEVLWINAAASAALEDGPLFGTAA
jgi:DNA adenine methylase